MVPRALLKESMFWSMAVVRAPILPEKGSHHASLPQVPLKFCLSDRLRLVKAVHPREDDDVYRRLFHCAQEEMTARLLPPLKQIGLDHFPGLEDWRAQ